MNLIKNYRDNSMEEYREYVIKTRYGMEVGYGQEIIRCKNCKHRPKEPNWKTYESGFDLEFPEGSKCPCCCYGDEWYSWYPEDDWFCANGERRTN